jgi:hypothetical protein
MNKKKRKQKKNYTIYFMNKNVLMHSIFRRKWEKKGLPNIQIRKHLI